MTDHDNIDTVKVDTDERGFQLIIETEDGERHLFPMPSGAPEQLVAETEKIRTYLSEIAEYRREWDSTRDLCDQLDEIWDPWERFKMTGDSEPLMALADIFNKARRER